MGRPSCERPAAAFPRAISSNACATGPTIHSDGAHGLTDQTAGAAVLSISLWIAALALYIWTRCRSSTLTGRRTRMRSAWQRFALLIFVPLVAVGCAKRPQLSAVAAPAPTGTAVTQAAPPPPAPA